MRHTSALHPACWPTRNTTSARPSRMAGPNAADQSDWALPLGTKSSARRARRARQITGTDQMVRHSFEQPRRARSTDLPHLPELADETPAEQIARRLREPFRVWLAGRARAWNLGGRTQIAVPRAPYQTRERPENEDS